MTVEDDWSDFESGPFCPHFSELHDCDLLCKCGHTCSKHAYDEECLECDCEGFREAEESG